MLRTGNLQFLIGLALAAMTMAVFYQTLRHDFIEEFDDDQYVTQCELVRGGLNLRGVGDAFTTFRASNWHPLTWLSLMTDRQFFGKGAAGFHFTNLLLHTANVLLLFLALADMTDNLWRSGLVAALFAVHRLHVESVAWIAERKDVLSTFFWMLVLWSYSHYSRSQDVRWLGGVCLFLACGLMAKPMLVTLPCVLLLLDFWPLRRIGPRDTSLTSADLRPVVTQESGRKRQQQRSPTVIDATTRNMPAGWKRLILEKIPLFALVAASCCVTLRAQQQALATRVDLSFSERLANAVGAYGGYLNQTFWPAGLAAYYPHSRINWAQLAPITSMLILSAVTLLVVALRSRPWMIVGWLWYLGTLVPVIGLVQVGGQAKADRYTYVPLIGIFLMIAWSIPEQWCKMYRMTATVIVSTCLGALMLVSWRQVDYWRDSETLFKRALAVTDDNWAAHVNLGTAFRRQGRTVEAQRQFRLALRIMPNCTQAHVGLADIAERRNDLAIAQQHAQAALDQNPNLADAHEILGLALAKQGRHEDAIDHFRAVVHLTPENAGCHFNLGSILASTGQFAEAKTELEITLRLDPQHPHAEKLLQSVRNQD